MKKFAKMSLLAAIAVAGTTASAQPLVEAIKNVDVSGTVAYRYNDYEDQANGKINHAADETSDSATNNYKVAVNLSSKVNDDVKFNSRFMAGSDGTTDAASIGTSSSGDSNLDFELSEVNFTYTGVQNLAVTLGKQAVNTPWTVTRDAMGDEQTGTGAFATYNLGPVTFAGAYFNQTNFQNSDANVVAKDIFNVTTGDAINGSTDIYVVGAMATFEGITIDAFYSDLDEVFDAYTVGLSASYDVAGVNLSPFARYSALDLDDSDLDNSLWQIGMGAKMGIFSAFAAYGETDEEGGLVFIDSGSKTNMDYHWRVTAFGEADSSFTYVHATADVTDKINAGIFYSAADYGKDTNGVSTGDDTEEIYLQVKYQMSSNLATYVRYGDLDVDDSDEDGTMGRLHVQYSF